MVTTVFVVNVNDDDDDNDHLFLHSSQSTALVLQWTDWLTFGCIDYASLKLYRQTACLSDTRSVAWQHSTAVIWLTQLLVLLRTFLTMPGLHCFLRAMPVGGTQTGIYLHIHAILRWFIGASKSFITVLFQFHFNCADCRQFTVQHTKEQQQPPNPRILIRHANRPMVSLSTHHRRQQFIHTVDTFWR